MKVPVNKKKRDKTFGTLSLVEDKNGEIVMHCDITETDGVDQTTLNRIRAAIAGLAYMYEHDHDTVDKVGSAYLHGLEYGIHAASQMQPEDTNDAKAGFRAKL